INPVEAVERHRASAHPTTLHPTLRDAMDRWIARQIENQEFRGATGEAYTYALAKWAYPTIGDVSVDKVTRVMVGGGIERIRAAKKSRALIAHVRMRIKGLYTWLIDGEESLKGMVNPAADLKLYLGKRSHRKKDPAKLEYFTQEEGPTLLDAARGYGTRWAAFVATGVLAGLRWGESAALEWNDIDWRREEITVRRTVSGDGTIQPPKGGKTRTVKASPALLKALRSHKDSREL